MLSANGMDRAQWRCYMRLGMITRKKAIVVLNAGSSSLKFSVYEASGSALNLVSRGQVEGLGSTPHFEARDDQERHLIDEAVEAGGEAFGHAEAFAHIARWLQTEFGDHLAVAAVGHRITHGGVDFSEPTLIDTETLERLEKLNPLAPLHQPHNLAGVRAVQQLRPDLPQVGCFDTGFHKIRAKVAERFGLPNELFDRGVKRWGFHGLSYESITGQLSRIAPHVASGRVIVAHLGSGASLCAMRGARSIDTTMSFSTLDGLPMGTRCGALDPGVVLFLMQQMTPEQIEDLLYRRSGLLGISGVSSDMRTLLASDDPRAAEAVDYFVYRTVREIGSLTAALGGLDALVFTAGVGENSALIRAKICEGLEWLGLELDSRANVSVETCISPPRRTPSVWVIRTDEEGVIAAHTMKIISLLPLREMRRSEGRDDRAVMRN